MPNPKTITERLTKEFERLDLEQPVQLRRLLRRCEADLATLRRAEAAVAEQTEKAKGELAQYEERRQKLLEAQDRLAVWVEGCAEAVAPPENSRSQAAADLRRVQIDLRMLEREKKDWELTTETMRHFAVDLKEAIGIVKHIVDSLKRNLERLKVAARATATTCVQSVHT